MEKVRFRLYSVAEKVEKAFLCLLRSFFEPNENAQWKPLAS